MKLNDPFKNRRAILSRHFLMTQRMIATPSTFIMMTYVLMAYIRNSHLKYKWFAIALCILISLYCSFWAANEGIQNITALYNDGNFGKKRSVTC